ncbi:CBO0543 family protein [Bacillus kwashiorkori]|uniref:CBO0543 family protein n=1 Tax=Bacillus kwashiorkori TaxID=1522318 RepID=UPI0007825638|nr:CBO0543 family protein [Bacillus kwashiorkori]
MYLLIVVIIYIIFAYIFVDWKRWREFYPTIQFYIICNLLYNFLFYQHTLWRYKAVTVSWLNHTFIDITFTFFIVPVVLMMYLQHFPRNMSKKIIYVIIWVIYFSFIEFIFEKRGLFAYENGWNAWWSVIFNIVTFIVIRLHYRNPIIAFVVSLPIVAGLLLFFHPSLSELK